MRAACPYCFMYVTYTNLTHCGHWACGRVMVGSSQPVSISSCRIPSRFEIQPPHQSSAKLTLSTIARCILSLCSNFFASTSAADFSWQLLKICCHSPISRHIPTHCHSHHNHLLSRQKTWNLSHEQGENAAHVLCASAKNCIS